MMNDLLIEIVKIESIVWLLALLPMCALAVEEMINN
jgi:hypothetical protein